MNAMTMMRVFASASAVLFVLLVLLATGGCAVVKPDAVDAGWSHTSHPLRGWPFGPPSEEDSLDTLGARSRWEGERCFVEIGLSYRLRDGGFYGDDFVFESRVGIRLWEAK